MRMKIDYTYQPHGNSILGFLSLDIDCIITIKNIKLIKGKYGYFLGMPSLYLPNRGYEETVYLDSIIKEKITKLITEDIITSKEYVLEIDFEEINELHLEKEAYDMVTEDDLF